MSPLDPPSAPTGIEIARAVEAWAMTYEEARATLIQDAIDEQIRAFRAHFSKLSELDTTEFQEHVDSARNNATETCIEEGQPNNELLYLRAACSTLETALDQEGIKTPKFSV